MASSEPVSGVRILGVMLPGGGTKVAAVGPVGVGSGPGGGQEVWTRLSSGRAGPQLTLWDTRLMDWNPGPWEC